MSIDALLSESQTLRAEADRLMSAAPAIATQSAEGALARQHALEKVAIDLGAVHTRLVAAHTALAGQGFSPMSGLLFNEIGSCLGVMMALGKEVGVAAAYAGALATGVVAAYRKTPGGILVPVRADQAQP